jgi:predicted ATPase
LRLQAELLSTQGAPELAIETCYRQALELAQRQQARALALRAAMGLARRWQTVGRDDEARRLLASIYAWFTEGMDTPDLRAAHTLLTAKP